MKKIVLAVFAVLMSFWLSGCATDLTLADCFDRTQVTASAREAIKLVNQEKYDEFIDWFIKGRQEDVRKALFDEQMVFYIKAKGGFNSFEKEAVVGVKGRSDQENYAGVVVLAKHEKATAQYTLTFDEDMKLLQFVVK